MPVEVEEMKMARLIDADKINYHEHTECMGHGDFETVRTVTDKEIAEIPTADVAPVRHGRWICIRKGYGEYECSVCHGVDSDCSDYYGTHVVTEQDYCPNCGSRMDRDDDE